MTQNTAAWAGKPAGHFLAGHFSGREAGQKIANRWPALLLLLLGGICLGGLAGVLARSLYQLPPATRWMALSGLFLLAAAVLAGAAARAERQHELLLAGYDEKQRFYNDLLDSLLTALETYGQPGEPPAGPLLDFLQDYRADFYTYASGRVIGAVNACLAAAEKASGAWEVFDDGAVYARLRRECRRVIRAVKDDLGQPAAICPEDRLLPAPPPLASHRPRLRRLK
jgi:hypothetical protein